jgi:hypothetical protein
MHAFPLYPLQEEEERLARHCKLPLHFGKATIGSQTEYPNDLPTELYKRSNPNAPSLSDVEFDAAFLMPAAGDCLIFLQGRPDFRLHQDFGQDLTVSGDSYDGPFKLFCPEIYIEIEGEGPDDHRWAIAKTTNKAAVLTYGDARPIARVNALINNFDFRSGNEPKNSGNRQILRVHAAGKEVDFVRREGYEQVKTLLTIGASGPAALTSFSFGAWDGSTVEQLQEFAFDIAGLCGIVARQHTGIPLLSFLDADSRPIKCLLGNSIESSFRGAYVIEHLQLDRGLPQLFSQCFENYQKMKGSGLWATMPAFCISIEDSIYLEQKCAMLMAGLERLMRNSLVEANHSSASDAEGLMLTDLIGAARAKLGWNIPKHYTTGDRVRELRNAVAHGGPLPQPPNQVRHDLDKWSLFLMRRVLMQLGFDGPVRSPNVKAGEWSESPVNDFSEEHNSFET